MPVRARAHIAPPTACLSRARAQADVRERLRLCLQAGRAARMARRNVFVVDGCCGTATSAALYHLMTNRYARVIGIDRDKREEWVRKHIPAQYQRRFVFVAMDMAAVSVPVLERVMQARTK